MYLGCIVSFRDHYVFGTSLGPYIIASLGNPFDGLTLISPFATNPVKLNIEILIIVM